MFYPKRYSSWPHVCHIILKVSFFFIVMFSYVCCNLLSLFFIHLSDLKKPPLQKKSDKMIIFIAGISMEFSSQFGCITTRGIAAQLFLKILVLVFLKKCVYVNLTEANHYFFGCKRFRQSNINESFYFLKKKRVSLYVQFQKYTRSPTFRPIFLCQFPNFYSSL